VDYNEIYNPNGAKKKKATRRGRKKADAPVVEAVEVTTVEETNTEA
jgi:large subunit ribosomal protein L17